VVQQNIIAVRTIVPAEFRESRRDWLTGGLPQQLPFRMTTDSQGRILVTDPYLSLVHVLDVKDGNRWQIRGDRNQRMVFPTYIAVDGEDNIYVSEPLLFAILVFRPDGKFLRTIRGDRLMVPFGLAVDERNDKLYVVDNYRNEIQVYTLDGKLLQVIAKQGTGPGELMHPSDLVIRQSMIFVLDTGNRRFQVFDSAGNVEKIWPFGPDRWPVTFTLDAVGNLYYVDLESLGMLISDPAGSPLAALDIQVPYGQVGRRGGLPSFLAMAPKRDGSMLALRPGGTIEIVKLE
jgi:sugar lactone lactonase YvrE